MNVSLTPQLEEMVRSKVASGRYGNASEVIREALRLLEDYDRYESFRAAVAVGYEQAERGELLAWTPELRAEIMQSVEQKARDGHRPNPDVLP